MYKRLVYLLIAALACSGCADEDSNIYDLQCDYMCNPLGIDSRTPHFSWKIAPQAGVAGFRQSGYRILVATSPDKLDVGKADVWDSQEVASPQSHLIPFGGKLESSADYYWRVVVFAPFKDGKAESPVARFSTGIFDQNEWKGEWLKHPTAPSAKHVWFRKKFVIDDHPEQVFAHVASTGYHELYVNGQKVDDRILAPALARIDKRVLYVTYDLAPLLNKGENVLALWSAAGWARNNYFEPLVEPAFIVQLNGKTQKGKPFSLCSDNSWKCCESYSRNTGKYNFMNMGGEEVDGRRYSTDWNTLAFDDSQWTSALALAPLKKGGELRLSAQMTDPTVVIETIPAKRVADTAGYWRVDMGKSFTGFLEAAFEGLQAGDTVVIRVSNCDSVAEEHKQIHYYIARGENGEKFANRFNFFGGRYISFFGLKRKPEPANITGYAISSAAPRTGYFECSNELFNRIHEVDRWTYEMCTTEGFTVDCPNRERLGYGPEGAYQTTWGMGLPCFASGAFYMKNVRDWCDVQREDGSINYVAPQISDMWGSALNGNAVMNLAWEHYQMYGDKRILQNILPTAKRWIEYLNTYVREGMLTPFASGGYFIGDWVSPGPVFETGSGDNELFMNNCVWLMSLELYMTIVHALGAADGDVAQYRQMLETGRIKIHEKYYNPAVGSYLSGDQVRTAFALFTGVVPDELKPAVVKHLEDDMTGAHPYLNVGSFGRYPYYQTLFSHPQFHNIISGIMAKTTYPGYGYFIAQGETTFPEVWEITHPNCAQIHTSYSGISAWFVKGLAGINPARAGYSLIRIEPQVVDNLEHAGAGLETPFGLVESGWRKQNDTVIYKVSVPTGAEAEVVLPAAKLSAGDGQWLSRVEGVKSIRKEDENIHIHIVSGNYTFRKR